MLDKNMDNTRENESELTEIKPIKSELKSELLNEITIDDEKSNIEDFLNEVENDEENRTVTSEDFSELSIEELLISLKNLIENNPVQKIKTPIDQIKNAFNQKFGVLLLDKKQAFLDEGG